METLKSCTRAPNLWTKANWFSKLLFWPVGSTIRAGWKRKLNSNDIYEIAPDECTACMGGILERKWKEEVSSRAAGRKPRPFVWLLAKCIKWKLIISFFGDIFEEACKFGVTVMLRELLRFVERGEYKNSNDGYFWAMAISIVLLLNLSFLHSKRLLIERAGLLLRSAVLSLVYRKSLRISQAKLSALSSGHVVTLMSSDAQKILMCYYFVSYAIVAPMTLAATVIYLWFLIGPSCFVALGSLVVLLLVQTQLGKLFGRARRRIVSSTEKRVKVMKEIISSMQVIKMYCWEEPFAKFVQQLRGAESAKLRQAGYLMAVNSSFQFITPVFLGLAVFATFYKTGEMLSVSVVFMAMALFNNIRMSFGIFFPMSIRQIMEGYVSAKRIETFLLQDEVPIRKDNTSAERKSRKPHITFKNLSVSWSEDSEKPTISNLSFRADAENNLIMITGPVGVGKSTVLMAALNEIKIMAGGIESSGQIAYAAQQAWIFSGTVKDNVLFGQPFDESRYNSVLNACGLDMDLVNMPDGDNTLIGDRGITLSGGQKARVSLARAVYFNADVYLLDDPLSAVDTKVGKHIFENCLRGLLKNKIVLLATHQIQYLHHATEIICLTGSLSTYAGSLEDLSKQGIDLMAVVHPETLEKDWEKDSAIDAGDNYVPQIIEPRDRSVSIVSIQKQEFRERSVSGISFLVPEKRDRSLSGISLFKEEELKGKNQGSTNKGFELENPEQASLEPVKKSQGRDEEKRSQKAVSFSLYGKYVVNGVGIFGTIVFLLVQIATQVLLTASDWWLGIWAKGEQERGQNRTITTKYYVADHPDVNLYIYIGFVGIVVVVSILRNIIFYLTLIRSSRHLHNKMFYAVLKAPLHFFDTNPVGQILNRFSRDIFILDEELPSAASELCSLLWTTLAIVVVNIISVPYNAVVTVPLLVLFMGFRAYYMRASREIKRIEATSRSPMYTHLSASLEGLVTIRAFGVEKKLTEEFNRCQDHQAEGWQMFITTTRWFTQRLDVIAVFFTSCTMFAPLIVANHYSINPALVAVSLSYSLRLCGMFQFCIRRSAEVGNMMTSVERIFEYASLDSEPDNGRSENLPKNWPQYGLITAESASFAYDKTLPYVLKKVFFCIRAQEKVGIVGRTGAGKSSLVNMILRLAHGTGTVRIDGYPIDEMTLKDLRRSISVIPQDLILFSGSLRYNLDPFNEFSDSDLWQALEEVQMKEHAMSLPSKLSENVAESGSNFSVGQRQLLCLARAILKKNKIMIIDEATANVDYETDALIQRTIRENFKDCTVLTVAHRLNTIMDSDRVMVMDAGKIVEFDEPYQLLKDRQGFFRRLVDQAGRNEAARMEVLAQEAKAMRHVLLVQNQVAYPGSHITVSKSKHEIIDYFGTHEISFESTV